MRRDLTGQRFGKLVAVEPTDKRVGGSVVWICKCDCGKTAEVPVKRLTSGATRSCGCLALEGRSADIAGQRFGRLVAIRKVGSRRGHALWLCECDCGNEATVAADSLVGGRKKSCGCLRPDSGELGFAADLTGQRFGRLTAIRRIGTRGTYALWQCACDCGNICEATSHDLKHGGTRSCGCLKRDRHGDNLTGRRFGRLLVLEPSKQPKSGQAAWSCKCDCGNVIEATSHDLVHGRVRSCGCMRESGRDFAGRRFGKLVAVEPCGTASDGATLWRCLCDCDRVRTCSERELREGAASDCGRCAH